MGFPALQMVPDLWTYPPTAPLFGSFAIEDYDVTDGTTAVKRHYEDLEVEYTESDSVFQTAAGYSMLGVWIAKYWLDQNILHWGEHPVGVLPGAPQQVGPGPFQASFQIDETTALYAVEVTLQDTTLEEPRKRLGGGLLGRWGWLAFIDHFGHGSQTIQWVNHNGQMLLSKGRCTQVHGNSQVPLLLIPHYRSTTTLSYRLQPGIDRAAVTPYDTPVNY